MKLETKYMGLELGSPIVVSACPLSEKVENIVEMEDSGAGAVVLFSLFEEQIKQEIANFNSIMDSTFNTFSETSSYLPDLDEYRVGTERYLEIIRQAKDRVNIPIIASLNSITNEGWIDYAKQMQSAGADGIEINVFYIPADIQLTSAEVEQRYIHIVQQVKNSVSIPVAVKISPYFSAMANMAKRLEEAGADALVLFNRFYQPDFNIHNLKVVSTLEYSSSNEIRLPLLWISVLYGKINGSLAATTGIQSAHEIIKYLLAGADVTMTASSLFKNGIDYIGRMTEGLKEWMNMLHFESVEDFRGIMSQQNIADPSAFERANYIKILENS